MAPLVPRRALSLDIGIVALLTAVSIYLRWRLLGAQALNFTDSWVAVIVHLDSPSDVARVGMTAPGFTLLAKAWLSLVGFTPAAAQLPSFIIGSATAGLTYAVGRRMRFGPIPSLFAGAIIAFAPMHVMQSATLKPYALDALMSLVLIWLVWRIIDEEDEEEVGTYRNWLVVVGAATGASLASASVVPTAACSVAAVAIVLWRRGAHRAAVAALVIYGMPVGAWGLYLSRTLTSRLHDYWAGHYLTDPGDVVRIVRAFGSALGFEMTFVVWTLAAAALLGALTVVLRNRTLAVVLVGPFLVAAVLAIVRQVPLGTGRGDTHLFPVLAILGAWTIQSVTPTRTWRFLALTPIIVALAWPLPSERYIGEPSRPLVDIVLAERRPDEQVIANYGAMYTLAIHGPWVDGLVTDVPTVRGFVPSFSDPNIVAIERLDERSDFERAVADAATSNRVWVLYDPRTQPWTGEAIRSALSSEQYVLARRWERSSAVLESWSSTRH